ncbi:Rap guanine nucleotide exchange factor 4 [Acropora cervicornis]|uniref:Rap guanine nucleotide exchange factor 4 n=1 Tax=Acropora cervicornis TaxID=6130 RepID=A0AAD9QPY2_ACRCE|nr:Rap guanine nucleotide exchange factor 4 [Acropora cervicornis]
MTLSMSPKLICDRIIENRTEERCFIGSQAIDWLAKVSPLVDGRFHALNMLQALLEEDIIINVSGSECEFKDTDNLYRFSINEWPGNEVYAEEDLDDALLMLTRSGPDAQLRLALRKRLKKNLQQLLSLNRAITWELYEGEEGNSWYIIIKGIVNVIVHGKDVETNTVHLKEHGQDVLVLEKMNSLILFGQSGCHASSQMYSVMAGTPSKMVEYLLETRIYSKCSLDDHFLNDFLVAFPIFMTTESLCYALFAKYPLSKQLARTTFFDCGPEFSSCTIREHSDAIKKRVVQVTQRWCTLAGNLFLEDKSICIFIEDLLQSLEKDKLDDEFNILKTEMSLLHERLLDQDREAPPDGLPSRRMGLGDIAKLEVEPKPIRGNDQNVFPVFYADHSYVTLALPYNVTAQTIVDSIEDHTILGEDCLLCEVTSTGERIPFKEDEICVTTGLSVNGKLFIAPSEHLDSLTPTPEQEGPVCSSLAFLETYEFIYHVFGKEKYNQITANLDMLLRRLNEVRFWIETQVLLTQQLSKRVYLLKTFIKLAAHCKELNNWNSFFAILMALNSVAVSRLTQTWEKVPRKFRNILEQFDSILEPTRNHRVYRLLVGKQKPPILPFVPLLIKDMTFANEGNKTYLDDLVNFEKMRMIASSVRFFHYCRSEPFTADCPTPGRPTQEIATFVRDWKVIDNERTLTQLSHGLQPKKAS